MYLVARAGTKRRFELNDGTSKKFWEIASKRRSFDVRWGRLGANGRTQTKTFVSEDAARAAHDKLIQEKVGKGYVEIRRVGGGPPASPRGARGVEGESVEAQLARIDALLRDREPEIAGSFRRGAKPEAIARVAALFEGRMPRALRSWFAWHDGQRDGTWLLDEWSALSCNDVLATYAFRLRFNAENEDDEESRPFRWKPTWIPLFDNGSGDNVAIDAETGALRGYFHDDTARPRLWKDMTKLFDAIEREFRPLKAPIPVVLPEKVVWKETGAPTLTRLQKLPPGSAILAKSRKSRLYDLVTKLGANAWVSCGGRTARDAIRAWPATLAKPPRHADFDDLQIGLRFKDLEDAEMVISIATASETGSRLRGAPGLPTPSAKLVWKRIGLPDLTRLQTLPVGSAIHSVMAIGRPCFVVVKHAPNQWLETNGKTKPACIEAWRRKAAGSVATVRKLFVEDHVLFVALRDAKKAGKLVELALPDEG